MPAAPTEQMIQQLEELFGKIWKPSTRETVLTALLAVKVSRDVDGISAVLEPKFAELLQPIIRDELGMEASIQALLRLDKQEKKNKGGFFSFLKRN